MSPDRRRNPTENVAAAAAGGARGIYRLDMIDVRRPIYDRRHKVICRRYNFTPLRGVPNPRSTPPVFGPLGMAERDVAAADDSTGNNSAQKASFPPPFALMSPEQPLPARRAGRAPRVYAKSRCVPIKKRQPHFAVRCSALGARFHRVALMILAGDTTQRAPPLLLLAPADGCAARRLPLLRPARASPWLLATRFGLCCHPHLLLCAPPDSRPPFLPGMLAFPPARGLREEEPTVRCSLARRKCGSIGLALEVLPEMHTPAPAHRVHRRQEDVHPRTGGAQRVAPRALPKKKGGATRQQLSLRRGRTR